MPARDRGWSVGPRQKRAKIATPRGVSISTGVSKARAVRRAVPIPRPRKSPQNRPWQQVPANWQGPLTEWAVYWYLTVHGVGPTRRKLREGIDFFYQRGLRAPGLFASKPFTRGDFIFPIQMVVLDPITTFTHNVPWFDVRKRRILALDGWRVIFIDDWRVVRNNPQYAVELGLRGVDISARGQVQR